MISGQQYQNQLNLRPANRRGRRRRFDVGFYKTKYGVVIALEIFRKNQKWYFKCLCYCGDIFECHGYSMGTQHTFSCGCAFKELRKLHWKGHGEIPNWFMSHIKKGARVRNISFDVSIEFLWSLFLRQKRKCKLTGVDLKFSGLKGETTASLDRIDSLLGYTESNVQWVHKRVNRMKINIPQQEFIDWCKAVVNHVG